MNYIGIDLGTSAVKLLLVNNHGEILNSVTEEYPVSFPRPGWSEQTPEDWYTKTAAGIKKLMENNDADSVAGISFGGQMHGLVTLDENDRCIRPAILWNDGRSSRECEYLNNVTGREKLSEYCANIAFAGFTAPKLMWMRENEPENFERIKKIMLPKDYLAYRFSGNFSTDVSDASGTLFFDVKNRCWSKEMLKICHIDEKQLPKIYESYQVTGTLLPDAAKELGLSENVKIIAGAGDNAAAAIGTGTVNGGDCNISLGTSGTIFIAMDDFRVDENNALHSFDSGAGTNHLMGCILSAASCNKWWMEDIVGTKDFDGEQKSMSLGDNNVYFLPYLMGERSPHNDTSARGAFIGMSMDTTRKEMTQAVLEGVAFALRDSYETAKKLGITIEESKVCGGGAKSNVWKEILANVMNIKITTLNTEEGPSYGAAILAMTGCGEYDTVNDAVKSIVKTREIIEPKKELAEKYNEKYNHWVKLYPALKGLF